MPVCWIPPQIGVSGSNRGSHQHISQIKLIHNVLVPEPTLVLKKVMVSA
jgi:hypothetical protein